MSWWTRFNICLDEISCWAVGTATASERRMACDTNQGLVGSSVLGEQHVVGSQAVEALNFHRKSGLFLSFCGVGFFHFLTWPWMAGSPFEAAG